MLMQRAYFTDSSAPEDWQCSRAHVSTGHVDDVSESVRRRLFLSDIIMNHISVSILLARIVATDAQRVKVRQLPGGHWGPGLGTAGVMG